MLDLDLHLSKLNQSFFIILNCGCLRNVRRMQIADIMTGKDSHPSHTFFFIGPINATRFLSGLQVHYANNNKVFINWENFPFVDKRV